MKDPRQISIRDFAYSLPEEKIAKYPLSQRDASKLLIYKNGRITQAHYLNIATYIPEGSLLVFNDTKVVEARLLFQKPTGGIIEIFCLDPHEQYPDITSALMQKGTVRWQCMIGGASKWKKGQLLEKKIINGETEIILRASFIAKRPDVFIIELSWTPAELSFAEILHFTGEIPLPPYLKRTAEHSDLERYQTIYAKEQGSVAAPTAGLHFTEETLKSIREKNIKTDQVTLHVGAGTFKPVKALQMEDHVMHSEWIEVHSITIENILNNISHIVAVGTTSLRTIESLYWMGVRCIVGKEDDEVIVLPQWTPYQYDSAKTASEALQSLLSWMKARNMTRLVARTSLLVAPGYSFRIVKGLITNFHQPESTLLLLVAALIGEDWRKVYQYALENNFRFLSYGDGSLLWRT